MGKRGPSPRISAEDTLRIFESNPHGTPYTSREIADRLDCSQTTAYKKLQRLVADGVILSKKVGARGRVWWLPSDHTGAAHGPVSDRHEVPPTATEDRIARAIFEEAFDAILIADDDARYVDANSAACDLFGVSRDELVGRTIAEFTADGYDVETVWDQFRASNLNRGTFPLVRTDGEVRFVEFAATPNILPGRHLAILRDITEYRRAKEQLETERERVEQYRKTLYSEEVLELEFRATDDDAFFLAVSDRLECRCTLEGMVSTAEDRMLHYVTVDGAPAESVMAMAADAPQINDIRTVHRSGTDTLFEVDMATSTVKTLIEAGASGRTAVADRGVATIVAEAAPDADLRAIIEAFKERYEGSELVAKRRLDRPFMTARQHHESLADRFTRRQLQTLRSAMHAGYYEWPRRSTAEEIATSLGIASTTWLRHLRRAERTLVLSFVEGLDR